MIKTTEPYSLVSIDCYHKFLVIRDIFDNFDFHWLWVAHCLLKYDLPRFIENLNHHNSVAMVPDNVGNSLKLGGWGGGGGGGDKVVRIEQIMEKESANLFQYMRVFSRMLKLHGQIGLS